MSVAGAVERGRRLAAWIAAERGRTALAWGVLTAALVLALGGGAGISRDEAVVLESSDAALRTPGDAPGGVPPLAPALASVGRGALSPLGVAHVRAARAPFALAGGAVSALLAVLAWQLSGPAAALLAPALFWAAPRHLHAGLVASPDLVLAALALALALAVRRAAQHEDRRARTRSAIAAGVLFGLALAARLDAWVLLPALAAHAALVTALGDRTPGEAERGGRVPPALAAMAVLGPLVLVALWPALLLSSQVRSAALSGAGRSAAAAALGTLRGTSGALLGAMFPLAITALTVPATLLVAYAGGLAHAAVRLVRAPRAELSDDLLLVLLALSPVAVAAAGLAPTAPGVRPWLHAIPFLALLGARAVVRAAVVAWPARAAPLVASLALLALWPAFRTVIHVHPSGSSAWNELAGGAPGAATLGLPRADGGDASVRLLGEVNARARQGARVWWPSASPAAVRALSRDGRLRGDLAVASGPEDADVVVVTLDGPRDAEYRTWAAFRSARPVAGAYLDEVPLAFAYARSGAWR
jgi:hypothetical protein